MKRILITGSKGHIGKVLSKNLNREYNLTLFNLPEHDARNYEQLLRIFPGHDLVIHLAWNSKTENFQNNKIDPDNVLMFSNIYKAALKSKVPRVIMASSIHADDFYTSLKNKSKKLLSPYRKPLPDSPYGKDKIIMENLGKKYSKKGLEVICIRIGAIGNRIGSDSRGSGEAMATWLSFKDFVNLTKKIIEAKKIPNNFVIMYGVSNNKTRIHDYSNPFGWKPRDDSGKIKHD